MRAAVLTELNQPLSVEEVRPLPPGPRDVIVDIGASGVCHSDLSVARGVLPVPPPVVLGHEGVGRVVEVGSDVSRIKVGDRVVGSFIAVCGECYWCARGESYLCA